MAGNEIDDRLKQAEALRQRLLLQTQLEAEGKAAPEAPVAPAKLDIFSANGQPNPDAQAANRQSFMFGMLKPIDAGAQMLTRGIEAGANYIAPGSSFANWMAGQRQNVEAINEDRRKLGERAVAQAPLGRSSEFIGSLATTLPALSQIPLRVAGSAILGGATAGAAGGALSPVYGDNPDFAMEKAKQAGLGAAVGGVVGGVAGKISDMVKPKASGSAADALKDIASENYDIVDKSGMMVSKGSLARFVEEAKAKMAELGIDADLNPKTLGILNNRLTEAAKSDHTLKGVEILRRVIKNAAASNDASERFMASNLRQMFDDFVGSLGPKDMVGGTIDDAALAALKTAREQWARASKAALLEDILGTAETKAKSLYSQSGTDNAIRAGFRQLATNAKKMRLFDAQEQAAIRRVAEGAPLDNVVRYLGKWAPKGPVAAGAGAMVGGMLGGPAGAAAVAGGGAAMNSAAANLTQRRAQQALETILRAPTASLVGPATRGLPLIENYGQVPAGLLGQRAAELARYLFPPTLQPGAPLPTR